MFRMKIHGVGQSFFPLVHGLFRQTVDEIQTDVFEAGLASGGHGVLRLLPGVDAADGAEHFVVGGLHAQGKTVEPRPTQALKGFFVSGGIGVGLQGDLGVLIHLIELFHAGQQTAEPVGAQIAGGAAAEIDRVHQVAGGLGSDLRQMTLQRAAVGIHVRLGAGERVEIAVGAFGAAEGNVEVQTQGQIFLHGNFFHGSHLPLGRQQDDGLTGAIHLAGAAADAVLRPHLIDPVGLLVDAVHEAPHGADAAARAVDGDDLRQRMGLGAEGMDHYSHRINHLFIKRIWELRSLRCVPPDMGRGGSPHQ